MKNKIKNTACAGKDNSDIIPLRSNIGHRGYPIAYLLMPMLALLLLFSNAGYAEHKSSSKNQPAQIVKVDMPKNLQPKQAFTLKVIAKDDQAVTGIKIKYQGKTQIIKAKGGGKPEASFTVKLIAPKKGKQRLKITALDGSKAKAKTKVLTVDVRAAIAKLKKTKSDITRKTNTVVKLGTPVKTKTTIPTKVVPRDIVIGGVTGDKIAPRTKPITMISTVDRLPFATEVAPKDIVIGELTGNKAAPRTSPITMISTVDRLPFATEKDSTAKSTDTTTKSLPSTGNNLQS